MNDVFPALQARFNGARRLQRLARRLYHGYAGVPVKSVRAYVEVTCTAITNDFDSFDVDEPVYSLSFTIHTRDREPNTAAAIMREMVEVFDDADIQSAAFETVNMRITGQRGPVLIDGTYGATMDAMLHLCWKAKRPVERMGV